VNSEQAECGNLSRLLGQMGKDLDEYLRFDHPDAMANSSRWKAALGGALPQHGVGAEQVVSEMGSYLIPNGSVIPKPGCTSFITTGATSIGALTVLAGAVAAPQRFGLTAFNYLEEISLEWMAELFGLRRTMKGVYSSGGSVANLIALGAARQAAYVKLGIDVARDGAHRPSRIYASEESHHSIHRAAAVLGLGRSSVIAVGVDDDGRMCPVALKACLRKDIKNGLLPVAIVATVGNTNTGAIDPLRELGEIARQYKVWFHVDGAYGLPGILDPEVKHLYDGLSLADSVIVDPHKWLGAPVGIGVTYVRDRSLLQNAFSQGPASYLEGAFIHGGIANSMDSFGIPYNEFGVELSAPSRGAVVWALIKEVGGEGIRSRVCRHNMMAKTLAQKVREHPRLELVLAPTLSICCFRYVGSNSGDVNNLNRRIHEVLVKNGVNVPSTTLVGDRLVIRPCFIGARTEERQVDGLFREVVSIGDRLSSAKNCTEVNGENRYGQEI